MKKARRKNTLKGSRSSKNNENFGIKSLTLKTIPKGEMFLGFRLRNVNQLWRWDTLQDVNFK